MSTNDPINPLPPNRAIPWNLICKLALRGTTLESLSRQFAVSVDQIQKRLDVAVERQASATLVRIRSNAEINLASNRAKADLVQILQESINELVCSDQPRLSQLSEFQTLLTSAARLFSWPTVSVSRLSGYQPNQPLSYASNLSPVDQQNLVDQSPQTAVNLALIQTTPEQLALLAKRSTNANQSN